MQVRVADVAEGELWRVSHFLSHIRACANKLTLGVNYVPGTPNWDRVVEMRALTEALALAFPELQRPGLAAPTQRAHFLPWAAKPECAIKSDSASKSDCTVDDSATGVAIDGLKGCARGAARYKGRGVEPGWAVSKRAPMIGGHDVWASTRDVMTGVSQHKVAKGDASGIIATSCASGGCGACGETATGSVRNVKVDGGQSSAQCRACGAVWGGGYGEGTGRGTGLSSQSARVRVRSHSDSWTAADGRDDKRQPRSARARPARIRCLPADEGSDTSSHSSHSARLRPKAAPAHRAGGFQKQLPRTEYAMVDMLVY